MNHGCVALKEQRNWRDLRLLEQTIPAVRWVDVEAATTAPELFVVCGLWACREKSASQVLRKRSEEGFSSLLVARFEPVDMGALIGAPTSIHIAPKEISSLTWEDGQHYEVPGVTVVNTAISQGHWARSTAGTSILAYRPHTQAGLIVLCTATIAGVALGTDSSQQKALLQRVLEEMTRQAPVTRQSGATQDAPELCSTPAEYLAHHGPDGALVLLAALNADSGPVNSAALEAIGAKLPEDQLKSLVSALPKAAPQNIEEALRDAGWGAHLRTLKLSKLEAP
jgi:hypothetical protein